jgi:hypothetical protein
MRRTWRGGKRRTPRPPRRTRPGTPSRRSFPLGSVVAAGAATALAVAAQLAQPLASDVSWNLYAGARVLDGAAIGRDVVELTPPIILWIEALIAGFGRLAGLAGPAAQAAVVASLALASALVSAALVRRYRLAPSGGGPLCLTLVLLLVLLPGADFGQREHLALLLALPYVVLIAARMERATIPLGVAIAIGVSAGIGLSIKPQQGVIWAILVVLAAVRGRSARVLVRPEHVAIAATGALLLVAYSVFAPAYWPALQVLGPSYRPYLRLGYLETALLSDGSRLPLLALLAYAALRVSGRRTEPAPPLERALVLGIVATYVAAVLQAKGWRYHFLPALTLGALLLVLLAADLRPRARLVERIYHAAAFAAVGWLLIRTTADTLDRAVHPRDPRFAPFPGYHALVRELRQRHIGRLLVLSSNLGTNFPLAVASGAEWTSRYPSMWVLAGVHERELSRGRVPEPPAPGDRSPAERRLLETVAEDLERGRPDVILELRPEESDAPWGGAMLIPYVSYLRRADPRLERDLAAYRYAGDAGVFRAYRLGGVAGAPAPDGPAAIPGAGSRPAVAPSGGAAVRLPAQRIVDGVTIVLPLFLFALWLSAPDRARSGGSRRR